MGAIWPPANNATETPPSDGPSTSLNISSLCPCMIPCVDPASNYHFTRGINYYPMPSGRKLERQNAFTELSSPGAQTIVLGPLPPPTLPPHVRTSTLPPGHPPQSVNTGAFKLEEEKRKKVEGKKREREEENDDEDGNGDEYTEPRRKKRLITRHIQMERVEELLEELVVVERENGKKMDKLLDVLMEGFRARRGPVESGLNIVDGK